MQPGGGGIIARSAGTSAQILGKDDDGKYVVLRLKSGEMRRILARCRATIGVVGNGEHSLVLLGKAGRSRTFRCSSNSSWFCYEPNWSPTWWWWR